MERKISTTADGSHTIAVPELGVTYHSTHGAIQESRHVFINAGLIPVLERHQATEQPINMLEAGFGTGLNCLLTLLAASHTSVPIHYHTLELYPLPIAESSALNYPELLETQGAKALFNSLHTSEWDNEVAITPLFRLKKMLVSLTEYQPDATFDLVYFDAFAPDAQPELWTEAVFGKLYAALRTGGIITTYCSKGSVRRVMETVGFRIEKLKGPPGKREMVRAWK